MGNEIVGENDYFRMSLTRRFPRYIYSPNVGFDLACGRIALADLLEAIKTHSTTLDRAHEDGTFSHNGKDYEWHIRVFSEPPSNTLKDLFWPSAKSAKIDRPSKVGDLKGDLGKCFFIEERGELGAATKYEPANS